MQQSEWRFDSYWARDSPEVEGRLFEICRAYNNRLGQFWCKNFVQPIAPGDVRDEPIHGCRSAGKTRAHVCCRCRKPGHPWSLCDANDADLPRSRFDFPTKPPKPHDIREADAEARWEKYGTRKEAQDQSSSSRGH